MCSLMRINVAWHIMHVILLYVISLDMLETTTGMLLLRLKPTYGITMFYVEFDLSQV